jgi:hypothetical protein
MGASLDPVEEKRLPKRLKKSIIFPNVSDIECSYCILPLQGALQMCTLGFGLQMPPKNKPKITFYCICMFPHPTLILIHKTIVL